MLLREGDAPTSTDLVENTQNSEPLRRQSDAERPVSTRTVYLFRCGESGLYAFAADREGRFLPSRLYPRMLWRLERAAILRVDRNSHHREYLRAALEAISKHGFHLSHIALDEELRGFAAHTSSKFSP